MKRTRLELHRHSWIYTYFHVHNLVCYVIPHVPNRCDQAEISLLCCNRFSLSDALGGLILRLTTTYDLAYDLSLQPKLRWSLTPETIPHKPQFSLTSDKAFSLIYESSNGMSSNFSRTHTVRTNGRLMWTIDTKRQKTRTFQPKTDGALKPDFLPTLATLIRELLEWGTSEDDASQRGMDCCVVQYCLISLWRKVYSSTKLQM